MRLDRALVAAGLARSRGQAVELVKAGQVTVDGVVAEKPSTLVSETARLEAVRDRYVSRGAHKLLGALADTGLSVPPVVLDAGASTGGFTQVLIEHGAKRVYAVDVGHGQLHESLANDDRVVNIEGFNLRDLRAETFEPVDLVVGDLSFISLKLLIAPLLSVLKSGGSALLLVKPQFELERAALDSRGVVRDAAARNLAVARVTDALVAAGATIEQVVTSRTPGETGNIEFFVLAKKGADSTQPVQGPPY